MEVRADVGRLGRKRGRQSLSFRLSSVWTAESVVQEVMQWAHVTSAANEN